MKCLSYIEEARCLKVKVIINWMRGNNISIELLRIEQSVLKLILNI